MEISIKLKFLESLSDNKSLQILRVMTKGDIQKEKEGQLSSRVQKSNDEYLTSRRDYNTPRGSQPDTPRQAVTHRGGKSKQFKKNSLNKHYVSTKNSCGFSKGKKSVDKSKQKQKQSNSFMEIKGSKSKKKEPDTIFTGRFNGQNGKKIMKQYSLYVNDHEKGEIMGEKQIYYIGTSQSKHHARGDDSEGNYIWEKHDHLGFRYELIQRLGGGSFGQVIKAFDHKTKDFVAIKIIKSNKQHFQLALNEIKILTLIKESDLNGEKNCIRIKDFLVFRKHMCMIFELLSISLLDLLRVNNFQQMKMEFIRRFAIQIFSALAFLKDKSIIHSDIKPQNILLKTRTRTGIKIIDFGTSILDSEEHYTYVQSRYYRAPEVILGHQYSFPIDMWSVGCLLAQLHLGVPLFGGNSEKEQLQMIMEVLGIPTIEYLQKCKRMDMFFHQDFTPKFDEHVRGITKRNLSQVLKDAEFAQFLEEILIWETENRLTPIDALLHPWIVNYLPKQVRQQHISSFKPQIKEQKKRNSLMKEEKELKTARKKSDSKGKKTKKQSQAFTSLKSHRQSIEHKTLARRRSDA